MAQIRFTEASELLAWLQRDYSSFDYWRSIARQTFLEVAGEKESAADSTKARLRLVEVLQEHFDSLDGQPAVASRWSKDFTEIIEELVSPPTIVGKVEWMIVANHLLLGACAEWEEWSVENARRDKVNSKRRAEWKKACKKNPGTQEPSYLPSVGLYQCLTTA